MGYEKFSKSSVAVLVAERPTHTHSRTHQQLSVMIHSLQFFSHSFLLDDVLRLAKV